MKDPHSVSGYFYRGRWEKLADDMGKITRFTVCKVHLLQKLFAVWKIRKRVPNLMCTMKRDVLCSSSMFPRVQVAATRQRCITPTRIPIQPLTSAVLTWYWRLLGLVLRSQILSLRNWLAM